ncbi:hypothetical protein HDU91_002519 [Kappamyces sp. JEL0680]|nr:hypothetical protein HDU91_002519 [Kappamyces sp. JEL0680]
MIRKLKVLGVASISATILTQLLSITGNVLCSFGGTTALATAGMSVKHVAWVGIDVNLLCVVLLNLETLQLFSPLALASAYVTETRLFRFRWLCYTLSVMLLPSIIKQWYFAITGNVYMPLSGVAELMELVYGILVVIYDNLQLWFLTHLISQQYGKSKSKEGIRLHQEVLTLNQAAVCMDWFGVVLAVLNLLEVYDWHNTLDFMMAAVSSIHIGLLLLAVSKLKDLFKAKLKFPFNRDQVIEIGRNSHVAASLATRHLEIPSN